MKAIHSVHYAILTLAIIAVFALVSFTSANGTSIQLSQSAATLLPHIFAAIVLCVSVYEVNECSEHFVSDNK